MKHILICGLLLSSISFGLQAADSDLCSTNIQSLKDKMNSVATTDPQVKNLVTQSVKDAEKAKADGDTDQCIAITSRVISKLNLYNK
ncbi:hypothetical protein D3C87_1423370 [compost metagenome]